MLKKVYAILMAGMTLGGVAQAQITPELIERYAPQIELHRFELTMPTSAEAFLQSAVLKDGSGNIISHSPENFDPSQIQSDYYLDIEEDFYTGNPVSNGKVNAPVYVRTLAHNDKSYSDIQYILFYPYNGCTPLRVSYYVYARFSTHKRNVPLCNFGRHEGDWEHVTVRVDDATGQALGVFLSGHGGGHWHKYNGDPELKKNGTHPIVHSSLNGHAMYARRGVFTQEDLGAAVSAAGIGLGTFTGNPINWAKVVDVTTDHGTLRFGHYPNRSEFPIWETWRDIQVLDGSRSWESMNVRWGAFTDNSGSASTPNMEESAEDSLRAIANVAIDLGIVDDFVNGHAPRTAMTQRSFRELPDFELSTEFQIRLYGKCLDVPGNDDKVNSGANIQLWDCQPYAVDQRWYFDNQQRIRNVANDSLCLDVQGGEPVDLNDNVQLHNCHGNNNQKWRLEGDRLQSLANTSMQIAVPDNSNGANILVAGWKDQDNRKVSLANQRWIRCAGENETCKLPAGHRTVRYGASGVYAEKSTSSGSLSCNNSTFGDPIKGTRKSCEYETFDIPSGEFSIHLNGKCLDIPGDDNRLNSGENVQLWSCQSAARDQKWIMDDLGRIHNAADSNLCLDVGGGANSINDNVQLYHCHDGANQRWLLDGRAMRTLADTSLVIAVPSADNGANILVADWKDQSNRRVSFK